MHRWTPRLLVVALLAVGIQIDQVHAVPTGLGPDGLAVNPLTNRIYVRTSDDVLTVIDGSRNVAIAAVPLDSPWGGGIGLNAVTNRVYVGSLEDESVSVVDGASNKVIKMIPLGHRPHDIAGNPKTSRIYVATAASDNQNSVVVIDGETDEIATVIPRVGYNVAVNPETNRIYADYADPRGCVLPSAAFGDCGLAVIDGETHEVMARIPTLSGVGPLAVNPVTNLIYGVGAGRNHILVFDGRTNRLLGAFPTGEGAWGIAVNSRSNQIFVSCSNGEMWVIDGRTHGRMRVEPVGLGAIDVAVNEVNNRVYVANAGHRNVSVFYANDEFLINPSFESDVDRDGLPDGWRGRNVDADGIRTVGPRYDGMAVFRFVGQPGPTKELVQSRDTHIPPGVTLKLEAFTRAIAPLEGRGPYEVKTKVRYRDNTSSVFGFTFKKRPGWQRGFASLPVATEVNNVRTTVRFQDDSGYALFDALHLGTESASQR